MKALERASLPDPVPFQGWLHSLRDGAVSVAHASDELIDGLETLAQWGSEPLPPWHEAHEPTDQSPSEPASQLERGINAPTGDHTDGAQRER